MPYNNMIDRTDAGALMPEEESSVLLEDVAGSNPLLTMARRLPNMTRAQTRMPVKSALATAYFVSGDNGLKQTSEVNWDNRYLDAEELAVIVPIPSNVLDDSGYPIWEQVRPEMVTAINVAIAQAILYGTNIPASWSTNMGGAGICVSTVAGGASPATHIISNAAYTDWYETILGETAAGVTGAYMTVEADGFGVNGCLAHVATKGKLRNLRDLNGQPIFKTTMQDATRYELDGAQLSFPDDGSINGTISRMVVGDWKKLVWAMRSDINWKLATEAVIQDAAGNIVYNLFQQDMVALRATIRLAVALPNPINRMNPTAATRFPFCTITD